MVTDCTINKPLEPMAAHTIELRAVDLKGTGKVYNKPLADGTRLSDTAVMHRLRRENEQHRQEAAKSPESPPASLFGRAKTPKSPQSPTKSNRPFGGGGDAATTSPTSPSKKRGFFPSWGGKKKDKGPASAPSSKKAAPSPTSPASPASPAKVKVEEKDWRDQADLERLKTAKLLEKRTNQLHADQAALAKEVFQARKARYEADRLRWAEEKREENARLESLSGDPNAAMLLSTKSLKKPESEMTVEERMAASRRSDGDFDEDSFLIADYSKSCNSDEHALYILSWRASQANLSLENHGRNERPDSARASQNYA